MFGWFTDLMNMARVAARAAFAVILNPFTIIIAVLVLVPAGLSLLETFVLSDYIPRLSQVNVSSLFNELEGQSSNVFQLVLYICRFDLWSSLFDLVVRLVTFLILFIPQFFLTLWGINKIYFVRGVARQAAKEVIG